MNSAQRYQVAIMLQVITPVPAMWDQRKKRPVRMARWRKLSKYGSRSVYGKSCKKLGSV